MRKVSKLAVNGGSPAVTAVGPVYPDAGDLEVAWMEGVIRSGQWSWMGPHETAFCKEYAGFIGSRYCALLANGTVTLQCALQAVGVKPGDEVILPGLTWVATLQASLDIGANAVIVDIDPETYCISPDEIEKAITPKTKAIVPVHLYGCMADMDAVMDIARRYKLKVVEDAAHQQGSRWRNVGAGAIGDAGGLASWWTEETSRAVSDKGEKCRETERGTEDVGWSSEGCKKGRKDNTPVLLWYDDAL